MNTTADSTLELDLFLNTLRNIKSDQEIPIRKHDYTKWEKNKCEVAILNDTKGKLILGVIFESHTDEMLTISGKVIECRYVDVEGIYNPIENLFVAPDNEVYLVFDDFNFGKMINISK